MITQVPHYSTLAYEYESLPGDYKPHFRVMQHKRIT
jgi:hypothetical protein